MLVFVQGCTRVLVKHFPCQWKRIKCLRTTYFSNTVCSRVGFNTLASPVKCSTHIVKMSNSGQKLLACQTPSHLNFYQAAGLPYP